MEKIYSVNPCRIYIFAHYAQQPPYNTMLRYHNWGKYLVKEGFDVTIIAASVVHNTDIDVIKKINTNKCKVDGVKYYYIKTPMYTGNGVGRIKNMFVYCNKIKAFSKSHKKPDIAIASCAYVFPFLKHAYNNIPLITDVVDLWPLSMIEYTGLSKYHPFIQTLYLAEKDAYIRSDALIFSMEGGKKYIDEMSYARKVNPKKIFHVNMGIDLTAFDSIPKSEDTAHDGFTVTYSGSLRQANHVIQICEAAKKLKNCGYDNIRIEFYGNGSEEEEAKEYCKKNSLDNVSFHGRFQKEDIPSILSRSDVNIMTYLQSRVMKYGGSQSKLFDYLASGKPIINCGDWGYNLVSRYECGIVVKEQTGENIASAIESMYNLSCIQRDEMGKRARGVAEMYDQSQIVERLKKALYYVMNK